MGAFVLQVSVAGLYMVNFATGAPGLENPPAM
jgi:hypothetical protein